MMFCNPAPRYAFNAASLAKFASWRSAGRHEAGRLKGAMRAPSTFTPGAMAMRSALWMVSWVSLAKSKLSVPALLVNVALYAHDGHDPVHAKYSTVRLARW